MDRLALVELQHAIAVILLGDADVLVLGFGLVEDPALVGRLHRAGGQRDRHRQQRRQTGESPTEPKRGDERQCQREDEEGSLGAGERDQRQRGDHRPQQRTRGRERVEPPGDAAGVLDVGHREADRPRRAGPEQDDRDRDQGEHPEQGADERPGPDLVERVDGEVEERAGDERDGGEQDRRREHRQAEAANLGVAVGETAAEPIAG
jgi:hypothetical protein